MQKYLRFKKVNKNKHSRVIWNDAPDVKLKVCGLFKKIGVDWIKKENIFTLRSCGSKSRAIARIWGLPRVWQMVLKIEPHYIIEIISERFDNLKDQEKNKVLLHEIAHIPKNFSGALIPHYRKGKHKFKDLVGGLVGRYFD